MTTLYIVRHGQTLFNQLMRVQGWSDSPLTEKGMAQAQELGAALSGTRFDVAYSSDLKRALDTTELILQHSGNEIVIRSTPHLREAYYGGFEGGEEVPVWGPVFEAHGYSSEDVIPRFMEIAPAIPLKAGRDIIADNDPLGLAEDYQQVAERFAVIGDELLQCESETVLVVCHGGAVTMLLDHLLPERNGSAEVDNCTVTKVRINDGRAELLTFNEGVGELAHAAK